MLYLLAPDTIFTAAGDFNYGFLKVTENKLLDIFIDHIHLVNKPTYISGSLINHVYVNFVERIFN